MDKKLFNLNRGMLIAIEGIDGCGKDTVAKMFVESLERQQIPAAIFADLTDTAVGKAVRNIFLDANVAEADRLNPATEAMLIAAARGENLIRNIEPAYLEGKVIILNRYIESTEVYQGAVKGVSGLAIDLERMISIGHYKPMLTVWINTTPDVAAERMKACGKGDYHESKGIEFHNEIFRAYSHNYLNDPLTHVIVEGNSSLEDVAKQVDNIVANLLGLLARGQFLTPEYVEARKALYTNNPNKSLTEKLMDKVTAPEVVDATTTYVSLDGEAKPDAETESGISEGEVEYDADSLIGKVNDEHLRGDSAVNRDDGTATN